jgi:hypothetical protein
MEVLYKQYPNIAHIVIIGTKGSYLLQQFSSKKKFIFSTKSAKLMKISTNLSCDKTERICPQAVDISE